MSLRSTVKNVYHNNSPSRIMSILTFDTKSDRKQWQFNIDSLRRG